MNTNQIPNSQPCALLHLRVVPNASHSEIVGLYDGRIRIRIAAPPESGRANDAVCDLLARRLGLRRREVVIAFGATTPLKTVAITGLSETEVFRQLGLHTRS